MPGSGWKGADSGHTRGPTQRTPVLTQCACCLQAPTWTGRRSPGSPSLGGERATSEKAGTRRQRAGPPDVRVVGSPHSEQAH